MGFDIPMNTRQCMNADSLLQLNNPAGMANNQPTQQAPMQQLSSTQSYNQNQQVVNPTQPKVQAEKKGVHLKKGQKFALQNNGQSLSRVKIGLGWDVTNVACDLDASAFMLDANNKVIGDDWFVFYGQLNSPDNSVKHSGDSTGEGDGIDETITVDLNSVNNNVQKIVFVVTINEALEKGLNFSMVRNAYALVIDDNSNNQIAHFDLTEYYANVTSMVIGELYRHNGQWKFNAVGDGVAKDLAGLCEMYGVAVAD